MSKELVGAGGAVVGSAAYFQKLHEDHFIGRLMKDPGAAERPFVPGRISTGSRGPFLVGTFPTTTADVTATGPTAG